MPRAANAVGLGQPSAIRREPTLLTDLQTMALDNPGRGWTKPPRSSPGSRPFRQLQTDLDDWNLATDQKSTALGVALQRP
jgi:hypothetical protein